MIKFLLILILAGGTLIDCRTVYSSPLEETRYCYPIVRDSSGSIYRSSKVRTTFQVIHPCPVTGLSYGACPGWQVNHVIPLACGGCDTVSNMDWMPVEIKTCTAWYCRDKFERKIYGKYIGTNCTAPPLK